MAEVLIKYKADAGDLEATVNKINEVNNDAVKSAQKSATAISEAYKGAYKNAENAFKAGFVEKAIKGQITLVQALGKAGTALKPLANSLDETTKRLKIVVQSEDDLRKLEERLRKLSVEGKRGSEEFNDIAKAIGEYKAAIIAADRAVDLYAKSTDAATGRIGELEDKLYDLALAGKANTKEFNDLVKEVATVRRAVIETDAQVDALAQRGAKLTGFVQSVELVGVAFQAVEGAAALTGKENEELQKTLVKLQAIMAITSALEQGRVIIMEQLAAKTGIAGLAMKAYTFVTNGAATATKVWRGLLVASGIGAVVAILGALASKFLDNKDATKEAAEAAKEYQKVLDGLNRTAEQSAVKAGNAQIELLQKQGAITEERAKQLIAFNELQTGLSDAATDAKDKEAEAFKRFEEQKAADIKAFGKVTKTTQEQLSNELIAIETERANKEKELRAQAQVAQIDINNERIQKQKEAAEKAAQIEAEVAKAARETALRLDELAAEFSKDIRLKLEEDYQKELEKLAEDKKKRDEARAKSFEGLSNDLLNGQINRLKRLEAEEGSTSERRIELIELEAKKRIDEIRLTVDEKAKVDNQILLIEAETQAAIRDERKKSADERKKDLEEQIEEIAQIAQQAGELVTGLLSIAKEQSQARIDQINEQSKAELDAINKSAQSEVDKQRQREANELRTNRKIAAEKIKQAKLDRATALFEVALNTSIAVSKSIAASPQTFGLPFSAFALAQGLIETTLILSKPLPKYKRGGMVGGRSHEAGGTIIEAERGEFVVNRNAVSRHRSELDALNTSSAAFKKLIDERYVRPALNYYMGKKERAINVNASLNSKSMEREIKGMRRDLKRNNTVININGNDSRYSWHLN